MIRISVLIMTALLLVPSCASSGKKDREDTFSFEMHFNYPGSPDFIYEHLTGDISGWWDHSFSEDPDSLYIEARPGGGFYEIFDETGDGVRHAEVTYARKGKMLRMEGPLGLSGQAVILVCTYQLEEDGAGDTRLTLTVNGAGEFTEQTPGLVRQVWEHFLWERFRPYVENLD